MDTKIVIIDTEDDLVVRQLFRESSEAEWASNSELELDMRELMHIGHTLRMSEMDKQRGRPQNKKHRRRLKRQNR